MKKKLTGRHKRRISTFWKIAIEIVTDISNYTVYRVLKASSHEVWDKLQKRKENFVHITKIKRYSLVNNHITLTLESKYKVEICFNFASSFQNCHFLSHVLYVFFSRKALTLLEWNLADICRPKNSSPMANGMDYFCWMLEVSTHSQELFNSKIRTIS